MTFPTKEAAHDALEATRTEWLDTTRAIARMMGKGGNEVTVDDVRRVAPTLPDEVDPRVYGVIFRQPEWMCVGYRKSTRKVCHNRPIGVFVLTEFAAVSGANGAVM